MNLYKNNFNLKNKSIKNPPFFVLLDTNFIYFALKNKSDIFSEIMDCFSGKTVICVTECVILELEKLGHRFRLALRCVRDKRIQKLNCLHSSKIIYADDCICETIKVFGIFFVATCDKALKVRVQSTRPTPIISIKKKKFFLSN